MSLTYIKQDHKPLKDPSRLFESVVVVGLHPNCDIQALERQYIARKSEGSSGRLRSALVSQNHSRVEPSLEPQVRYPYHLLYICSHLQASKSKYLLYIQVLLVYPPDKQPPIKYKDLHSFCFPGGIEVLNSLFPHFLPVLLLCSVIHNKFSGALWVNPLCRN